MLAPHSFAGSLGWTAIAVIVPALARLAIDGGRNGIPFITFFPAIVLVALFLGWRYGVLAAAVSAAAARLLFMRDEPPLLETPEGAAILGLFVLSCALLISIGETLRRTFTELQEVSSREELLNEELRHRMKNMLAVVGSLASLSHRHADPERAHAAFSERLAALDRATSLLGSDSTVACALPDLAEEALRPFLSDYDIRLEGNPQKVHRDCCVPAVLAFHELATNAIKYGALSASHGWVELSWDEPRTGMVTLRWREHDGPPVVRPQRRGLGSRILSMHSPATSFNVDFAPDGVRCEMRLKAA
jgi:two-component sensor histidine kinase